MKNLLRHMFLQLSADDDRLKNTLVAVAFFVLSMSRMGVMMLLFYLGIIHPLIEDENRDWKQYRKIFILLILIARCFGFIPYVMNGVLVIMVCIASSRSLMMKIEDALNNVERKSKRFVTTRARR